MGLIQRLKGSRFVRDSAALQVAAVGANVGALATTVFVAHLLGADQQGIYYLAIACWSFLWFTVNLGLYNVAVQQIAAASSRDNVAKVGAWAGWIFKASLLVGGIASVLGVVALPRVAELLFEGRGDEIGHAILVLAATPFLELPRVVLTAALQGTRRMAALARVETGQELTRVFLVIAGALATGDALGATIGLALSSGFGSVLAIDQYRRERRTQGSLLPSLADIRKGLPLVPVSGGMRLGLRVGLMRNVDAYGIQILPVMLVGYFGGTEGSAYFRNAQRILDGLRMLLRGIQRTVLSHFSQLLGSGRLAELRSAYWKASGASGALMAVVLLGTLPLVPHVLGLFPADYLEPTWITYQILLPGVIVMSFSVANDSFYMVTNTLKVAVILQVVGLVFGLSLMTFFSTMWPTYGTAIGMSVGFLWTLSHMAYAWWWFRHRGQSVEGDPALAG